MERRRAIQREIEKRHCGLGGAVVIMGQERRVGGRGMRRMEKGMGKEVEEQRREETVEFFNSFIPGINGIHVLSSCMSQ